ncbi:SDR family NAD(P)-dependent oxidoreductase [Streptomyces phaeochromogenes]|uniref:SDR family NAD(P)-dependent oxidoreductase n=1 Tax=Streptomyces phaeochromogenes TaxID=1923 RepID=UPI002DDAC7DC|nr:SDR family NAD(P)-dependent oxidoreductase [Streptomyces phaeochromogenes]WRZ34479.1 SDR family oxidoreductase [Streptomyces phaeochromogenes]
MENPHERHHRRRLDFTGKSVTGAGSGIGRATALSFAAQGAKVVVADINANGAAAIKEIEITGGTALPVTGDLSDQTVVDKVIATTVDSFGGLDVLVNNAGIMDGPDATGDLDDAVWERSIRINLTAPFLLTRAALPHLLRAGKGAIVNTASATSLRGSVAGTAYTVSKHGIIGLTKATAVQHRDIGVRINAVAPGGVQTNIQIGESEGAVGPAVFAAYQNNIGRLAQADELAATIAFLASDAASDINGVVLPVHNGWSAV